MHYVRVQNVMRQGWWLFLGQQPINLTSTHQMCRACKAAAKDADIVMCVSMHTIRKSRQIKVIGILWLKTTILLINYKKWM
ncbi:MAG: hypothetical protein ACI936_003281 [Paraglaciecola sp.]|jgi:hypothetical protein